MGGPATGFERGSVPRQRLACGFRRGITGLDPEIGNHHTFHARLVARHKRREGRRIVVGDTPVTGAGSSEMLRDCGFHGGPPSGLLHQASSLISLMTSASTRTAKFSTAFAPPWMRQDPATSPPPNSSAG